MDHNSKQYLQHQRLLVHQIPSNHYFTDDLSPTHTASPPNSASTTTSWPTHRRSNTREDFPQVKHESSMHDRANGNSTRPSDDPMPSTSDFVKKLYKMLEDPSFQSVVCWGPQGDCFVVKDMNEFTKSILPRMFKHSNFASFVRQLNKYDFHKVKNTDDNQFGEHSWTFRHPDFHADRRDALENIKRKVPAARKNQSSASTLPLSSHPYPSASRGRSTSPASLNFPPHLALHGNTYPNVPVLQAEIQRLREEGDDLRGRIRNLERNYESVLVELVAFQRGMAQQDGLMQNMISYFLGNQSGKGKAPQLTEDTEARDLEGFFPQTDASASLPSSSIPRDPASSSGVQQLQTRLREQQSQRERAQISLQAQLHEARKMAITQERPSSPVSQSQGSQPFFSQPETTQHQPSSANPSSTSLLNALQYDDLSSLLDTNPFLPPQAVQRIIGSGTPTGPFTPNGSELGKASLLQMNELSRRVNGRDGNLWSGMNFTADVPSSSKQQGQQQALQNQPGDKLTSHGRERGWENSDVPQSISTDGNAFATRRTMSEERERVGFHVSMARDDSSIGMRIGIPEALEERRGRRQQRGKGDGKFLAGDDLEGVDQPEGYVVAPQVLTISPALRGRTQPAAGSITSTTKPQTTVPDPWACQPVLGVLNSSSRQGFHAGSSSGGPIEEDGISSHEGLQVYTVGHLLPKGIGIGGSEDLQALWPLGLKTVDQSGAGFEPGGYQDSTQLKTSTGEGESGKEDEVIQPTPSNSLINLAAAANLPSGSGTGSQQQLRVRRSTYVPGWAVPPRVLLVDDDAVSRKLSSKFLKVFGCSIDVAVDGVGAVNKMNLAKYDLVLMDIVMPKLDGVSATNLIRKFDQGTPIISMTSNSKPNEIMTYYSSGMNDILPKPFTKEGLLEMLEKHLMHLKVMQQMSRLPRSISGPMFEQSFGSNSSTLQAGLSVPDIKSSAMSDGAPGGNEATGRSTPGLLNLGGAYDRTNVLAGMGLTNDQYTLILQNMVNEDGFLNMMDDDMNLTGSTEKRSLDDLREDGRIRKRSRFETIE